MLDSNDLIKSMITLDGKVDFWSIMDGSRIRIQRMTWVLDKTEIFPMKNEKYYRTLEIYKLEPVSSTCTEVGLVMKFDPILVLQFWDETINSMRERSYYDCKCKYDQFRLYKHIDSNFKIPNGHCIKYAEFEPDDWDYFIAHYESFYWIDRTN